jgi:hypothetical protein
MTKHSTFVAHDAVAAQAQQHFSSFLPLATADARDRKKHTAAQKIDDAFLIWLDVLPQLSIGQPPGRHQEGKRCQTHTACIDERIILAYVQIILDFGAIHFKFHD